MPMNLETLRKLVALDESDPLSRFALGRKLAEDTANPAALAEAVAHLSFANERDPAHLATYHILGQALLHLGRRAEARRVLTAGCRRVADVGEGMGRDLGPLMAELLRSCPP